MPGFFLVFFFAVTGVVRCLVGRDERRWSGRYFVIESALLFGGAVKQGDT